MIEEKTIKHADLAHHWGCSPANVSNLVKRRAMPAFRSLAEADAWREVHAPTRKRRQTSEKKKAEPSEKNAQILSATTKSKPSSGGAAEEPAAKRIDVETFVDRSGDFIEIQLKNAQEVSQITFGLLRLKTEEGEPGAIAAASRNWQETSRHAADVHQRFMEIRVAAGALIPIDAVANIIVQELEEVRRRLKRLGKRAAVAANPAEPIRAEKAIDAEVDRLLLAINALGDRVRLELEVERDEHPPAPLPPLAAPPAEATPSPAPSAAP